ncbi:alpha/beta fold hydrolase [Schleiferia thermophila]|jgi:sigma-B regulation protein RsbQ|uniref:alpha/beta fold hydrolase n=1 Tax=Schleiferia thermophila TaxID=884107 RepID=UPI000A6B74DD|nr:alpha/beta hydrolase [Schleiferia thermophila]
MESRMSIISKYNIHLSGSGDQVMLFSHGYGCDQNMWRFVAPSFSDGCKIVLYDLMGAGRSDTSHYTPEKYNSLHQYADDVLEICTALDLKDVIFVGHSVSCTIGILAQLKKPDAFSHLILIGPTPCYINKDDYKGGFNESDITNMIEALESNFFHWASFITPVIIGNDEKKEFSDELRISFCSMPDGIAKNFAKVTFLGDYREYLNQVTGPALILQTNPDAIANVEVGKYVAKQIKNAHYVELPTSGHCPHLTAPDLVISAMKSYLK